MNCDLCGHSINKHEAHGCMYRLSGEVGKNICPCAESAETVAGRALEQARKENNDAIRDALAVALTYIYTRGGYDGEEYNIVADALALFIEPTTAQASDLAFGQADLSQHDLNGDDYKDLKATEESTRY